MPDADFATRIRESMERNRDVLNSMESHLGCATCRGPLIDGACPLCQHDKFEMGDNGKLRRRSDTTREDA